MSGSYVYIPSVAEQHKCELPTANDPDGTVWRCDDCGSCYRREVRKTGWGTRAEWKYSFLSTTLHNRNRFRY